MATLALNPLANPDFWGFYLGYSPGAPPPPPSLDALLAQAPLIVFGEVGPVDAYTEFATYDENGQPITDREGDFWASIGSTEFQLRVEEVWRDDGTIARGAPLILRMVGHADAVRKAWSQNADYPLSYTGDRHLFLLSPYPDGQAYGFYYGPWSRLIVEGSELYVSNGNRDPLRFAADEPPLTLDELRLAVASSPAPVIDLPVRPTPLPASTAATADVAQWPEYRHEQLGVSVRYPSDWQPWDRTAAAIRFGKSGQDEAFNVVNAGVQLDTISDFLQHIEPAATFTRTIQVDGQPALFMRFEPTQAAAAGYQSVVGILMPDGRAITVGNKTVDPIQFEQIVRTIRLFEPTLPP